MVRNAMSATEFYILQYLWTRETPATFSEIMVHFNETEHKEWKKQTVNTFLSRLSQKGFLNIDKSGKIIKVVSHEEEKNILTVSDREMDERAVEAVKAAINNAKICKKPIAGYDKEKKRAYVEYANGERKYV